MKSIAYMLLIILLFTAPARAAAGYNTGFRTAGVWLQEKSLRLDLNIWYPALRKTQEHNFIPWILNVALNVKLADGVFPLLIISHASPGTRFSYHYLASYFANRGYIVVAPTHPTDSMENMDDLFTWQQLEKRVKELRSTVNTILEDADFSAHIDKGKIGLIGFGTGATAGLLLAGAVPNCNSWQNYCSHSPSSDPYCTEWGKEKMNLLCKSMPGQNMRDERFKAFALIAPAYGMIFDAESFPENFPPIMLVGAGRDMFNNFELHSEPLARILGKKANYLHLAQADAGALMNDCPAAFEQELPELCKSVSVVERQKLHKMLENALDKFFTIRFYK